MISVFARPLKFLSREIRGMHEAAYLIALFSLASQILGLVRDHVFAATFGAGHILDLYYIAFRVPDVITNTIASLFSLYALMPILSRMRAQSEGQMVSFLRGLLGLFFAAMSVISLVIFILTPWLVSYLAPGIHDPEMRHELILLIRILLLQPIFLGASNTISALTQLRHRFVLYSISPLLYNVGIIIGGVWLYPLFGIAGLGWGVVLGAFMHVAIQCPYLFRESSDIRMPWRTLVQHAKEVLALAIPRTLSLASTQISLLFIYGLASLLTMGSATVLTFANNLFSVPLTLIGVSYSVAAFPTLAKQYAEGQVDAFKRSVEAALRHIIFWAVPATVFFIVLRAQIVRVILGAGQFDWNATRLTAAALALLTLSLVAQAVILLIARAYYAMGDTRKPLFFGIADILISTFGSYLLLNIFRYDIFFRLFIESLLRVTDGPNADVLMLAFGYALGSIAEGTFAYLTCSRDVGLPRREMARLVFESFSSAVIGASVAYSMLWIIGTESSLSTTLSIVVQGSLAGGVGLVVTGIILLILRNREMQEAVIAVKRQFRDVPRDTALDTNATQ